MQYHFLKALSIIFILSIFLVSCQSGGEEERQSGKLRILCSTTMLRDLAETIGGEAVEVQGLMGAGIDPHLYKASESDMRKISESDLLLYNGLHLEGKLEDVFQKIQKRGKPVLAIGELLDKSKLIRSENFASNYDPHIWFDLELWREAATILTEELKTLRPKEAKIFSQNLEKYLSEIAATEENLQAQIQKIPLPKRILITAHDAFSYFGRAYQFEVKGLQGISTSSEAGVKDVQTLAQYIADKKIKAIFVESSVPKRNIEALQAAVESRGFSVAIGGELFSDACGNPDSKEGNLLGMLAYNVNTIVKSLQ